MKVLLILTAAVMASFMITAYFTQSFIFSYIAAFVSLIVTASIIWRVDFGTWNCFE